MSDVADRFRFGDPVQVTAETRQVTCEVARTLLRPAAHIVAAHDTSGGGLPYNPADGWPGLPLPHHADGDGVPDREGDHQRWRRFPHDPHPGVVIGERHPPDPDWGAVPLYQVALAGDDAAVVVLAYPDDLTPP